MPPNTPNEITDSNENVLYKAFQFDKVMSEKENATDMFFDFISNAGLLCHYYIKEMQ